ncbi:hypothetical protein [Sphingomonas sp. PP-CC-3A-396]|uniref:hypothetical protein n=1 Tax=Sphingomonas sp. PP-CC-3A-396 TaxID=2135655 RepID=UPI00104EEFB2|nr:hypothetical protein [Sphingomonas sp. PP-CC-3A-396]TCQ04074.1 hypothetical protein C8J40_109209 [Sphingomonas sp. PP-CC-3A-396]
MTPNPNPSPELQAVEAARVRVRDSQISAGGDNVEVNFRALMDLFGAITALSPQTLPAPGEVERSFRNESLDQAVRRLTKEAIADSLAVITKSFDDLFADRDEWRTQHEALLEVRQQDLASLATVAAANDEAFARGVEASAKVLDARVSRIKSLYADEIGMSDMRVACEMEAEAGAAAIRLLSQGGGKA